MTKPIPAIAPQANTIVLATRRRQNAAAMQRVLAAQDWACIDVATVADLIHILQTPVALVIVTADVVTTEQEAKQLVDCLHAQPEWSDIPVIFLLKPDRRFPACMNFLQYVQQQRRITMLEMPLKPHEFVSVVQSCWRDRQRQYQLRSTLHQLNDSNQALESFSHTVAHELRNPLTVVTGSLEMLGRKTREGYEAKMVQLGLRTARNMNQILTTLLEYGKLNAQRDLVFEPVDMNDVVAQTVEYLQNMIEAQQAQVSWSELPLVWGNSELLGRLISNLIKNAIVHNRESTPVIMIQSTSAGNRHHFEVMDNGPGIAADDQQIIFEMFARVGEKYANGSGIGLALCQRIVEQHGGQLGVTSEVGQGSTFYFDLPKVEHQRDR